ncbi:MAG: sodium:proton antiporter [candidate division Zixibacteria bacterium RBG_16_53_22]|nr:MAG: sodium:proton antiporter [candidate division Zixibacteria bacterium RBG_16_53_22]
MHYAEAPPLYTGIPFIVLLLAIAILPLAAHKFWDKNRNKAIITAIIGIPALIYLLGHYQAEMFHNIRDYFSFIILLGSLFIISGGILLTGDLRATPKVNTLFLLIGGVIANVIGTTGASMLLIRPLLRTNCERKVTGHIPVFFIFVVSNIGGCLTPIGDPPLFLGYLRGVPFTWTLRLLPEWVVAMAIILTIFYIWDRYAYRHEAVKDIRHDIAEIEPLRAKGTINFVFLAGVVLSVALQIPGPYREIIMVAMTGLSLSLTRKDYRLANKFTYHPIAEVAILFAGIFVTMVPLLIILHEKGAALGLTKQWQFFWATGGLSSFLDNAPTYLTFFSAAESVTAHMSAVGDIVAGVDSGLLRAISCGAVFMGANTYIGNGPNFMVKAISDEQCIKAPHFFGYMAYSGLILIPVFVIITLIFFRG